MPTSVCLTVCSEAETSSKLTAYIRRSHYSGTALSAAIILIPSFLQSTVRSAHSRLYNRPNDDAVQWVWCDRRMGDWERSAAHSREMRGPELGLLGAYSWPVQRGLHTSATATGGRDCCTVDRAACMLEWSVARSRLSQLISSSNSGSQAPCYSFL